MLALESQTVPPGLAHGTRVPQRPSDQFGVPPYSQVCTTILSLEFKVSSVLSSLVSLKGGASKGIPLAFSNLVHSLPRETRAPQHMPPPPTDCMSQRPLGSGWTLSFPIVHHHCLLLSFLSLAPSFSLDQPSPTFLTPGTGFMENNFSMDRGGVRAVWMAVGDGSGVTQAHYIHRALCCCYLVTQSCPTLCDPHGL